MFSQAQIDAIRADVGADPILSTLPHTGDGAQAIADTYNALAAPPKYAWSPSVAVASILDNVIFANYTPNDTPDSTVLWGNRAMALQIKQINLQVLVQGRETLDATRSNIRSGLQDALSQLPSGNGGAVRPGGWANVQPVLSRRMTRLEALLATGTGTQADPASMGYVGAVSYGEIVAVMGW